MATIKIFIIIIILLLLLLLCLSMCSCYSRELISLNPEGSDLLKLDLEAIVLGPEHESFERALLITQPPFRSPWLVLKQQEKNNVSLREIKIPVHCWWELDASAVENR